MNRFTAAAVGFLFTAACASSSKTSTDDASPPPPPASGASTKAPMRRPGQSPAQASIDKSKKLAAKGELDAALAAAKEAIAQDPNAEEAYLLAGSTCQMKEDAACAAEVYEQGTKALPASAALLHARGMLRLESQDITAAVPDLEKALELSGGKDAEIAADLAYAYVFANRLDDAEKTAVAARKLAPSSYPAAFSLGEVMLRREKWDAAIEAYQAALQATPDEPLASRRLALALSKAGQHDKALALYERLSKSGMGAEDPALFAAKAGELIKLGRSKDAVKEMKEAVRLAPEEPKLLELLARAEEAAGDEKAAKATRAKMKSLGDKKGSRR